MVDGPTRRTPGSLGNASAEADLAGALHEVSNALTVVLGWLDAARRSTPDGPARDAVEVARAHAQRGHWVARRAIGAEVDGDEAVRSAGSVVRDAVLGVQHEAARRQVVVEHLPGPGDDQVIESAPAVLQILLNLLLNALAFTPSGLSVRIGTELRGAFVAFQVRDSGPGLDPSRADTLFTGPDSTRRGGAGVGLRHSAALATARGGELSLLDPGPGACFELVWPVSDLRSSARQRSSAGLAGLTVLVLEDDAAVLELVDLALGARGATVHSARDLASLGQLARTVAHVDASLVDLSPLGPDPEAALADLQAATRGARIVLISGAPTAPPSGVVQRAAAWVRKPFEITELCDTLAQLPLRESPRPASEVP